MRQLRFVDLFAGSGGTTTGVVAGGGNVVFAANHWPEAVAVHRANHPGTEHSCQDLHQADWSQVPRHDVLMASPACTGFTRARGRERSTHDAARSTAWAVVSCAEHHLPPFLVVENVPEMTAWVLWKAWIAALEALGYSLTFNTLNAADFGVPQSRKRLFVVGTLSGALTLENPRLPHVAARGIVDWCHPRWSPIETEVRAERTLACVAAGRERYGDRFLIPYYGSERRGRSVDAPFGTLRTKDTFAVVDGDRMRMLTVDEIRHAMGFPEGYRLPRSRTYAVRMLGNAVCPPVAEAITRQIIRAGA